MVYWSTYFINEVYLLKSEFGDFMVDLSTVMIKVIGVYIQSI